MRTTQHPTDDAALDRLHAEAPTLHSLLVEYLEPILPAGMSATEWKIDFDTRVRASLIRIAGPEAFKKARAA